MSALPVTLVKADDCQLNWESMKKSIAAMTAAIAAAGPQVGDVKATATTTAPLGFLACDGTSYLRSAQPALFTAIGTTFGAVDGTHFTVPDFRGRVPMGAGTATGAAGATAHALGASGGEETHAQSIAEIAAHDHLQIAGSGPSTGLTLPQVVANLSVFGLSTRSGSTGSGTPMNNLQPFQVINWWIKS